MNHQQVWPGFQTRSQAGFGAPTPLRVRAVHGPAGSGRPRAWLQHDQSINPGPADRQSGSHVSAPVNSSSIFQTTAPGAWRRYRLHSPGQRHWGLLAMTT